MTEFKNIREIIEYSAKNYENNLAFKLKRKENGKTVYDDITFLRLFEEIKAFGKYLIRNGLSDKRIAVIGKNSYEWMIVYLGVLCAGGVIVPLDKGLLPFEIKEQLKRSKADLVFYANHLEDAFSDVTDTKKIALESDEFKEIIKTGKSLDNDEEYQSIKIDNDKMSILIFTSGTTQKSKAVMLSQKNIAANVNAMNIWETFYETDVNLAILPFHHAFGMTQVVLFISNGMCNVFAEGLRIANALKEYKVSTLVGVPLILESMKKIMLKEIKRLGMEKKFNFGLKISGFLRKIGIDIRRKLFKDVLEKLGGELRVMISGAAAIKPETAKFFNDIGILLIQGYGLSETSPVVAAENEKHIRYGSIGFPLPGVEVRIEDKDENGIGELTVKGDNVMLGYYEDEENTKAVLNDGWFSTGDMCYRDKDGYIYITGRKKNVIVLANGKNVFPEEIEELLNDADIIKECIVYNKKNGEKDAICAKIVFDTDVEADENKASELVKSHIDAVNQKLIRYKQIVDFEITDVEMEKTTTGKIKRRS